MKVLRSESQSLPGCLADFAKQAPDRPALRQKHLGIWKEISWSEYHQQVRAVARKLDALGVKSGDCVAILSDNCPEWLYADLGAQSLGARAVGIYQTNPPAEVAYVLNDSKSVVLFCEDQEQVDKAVEIADTTPSVKHVVVFDPRGTRHTEDSRLISYEDFIADGLKDDDPQWYADKLDELDPDAPAMVVYTSGTTGNPKGAMLSSANAVVTTRALTERISATPEDAILSYLPLCHVAEKIFSVFIPLSSGAIVHFGESIETVQQDLREVAPTIFLGVPRIWEKVHTGVSVKMNDSSWLKRTLYKVCTGWGMNIAEKRLNGALGLLDKIKWFLADMLIFRALQERLGFRRCWLPISGAAPISAELLKWYHGIGIRICEGYGMTETSGVSHINYPGTVQLGSVGQVAPTIECKTDHDGEVLVKGPAVFCGYLNLPEVSAQSFTDDKWLRTGDIGSIDDQGYLRITGRKKEIIITSGGKNLSPEKIENAVKASPYVKECVAIGDKRKFVSALIQAEYMAVSDWAQRQKIPHTSYADLVSKEQVIALIQQEVTRANELLARVEQVRKFELLPKELNQDEGELTATQKVRRSVVQDGFAHLIDQMYGGSI